MTIVTIDGVEIDLERFLTELRLLSEDMDKNSLLIASPSGLNMYVNDLIEEQRLCA